MELLLTKDNLAYIIEEYKELKCWEQARDEVVKLCGETAYEVRILAATSNFANELSARPEIIIVFDQHGNLLLYDQNPFTNASLEEDFDEKELEYDIEDIYDYTAEDQHVEEPVIEQLARGQDEDSIDMLEIQDSQDEDIPIDVIACLNALDQEALSVIPSDAINSVDYSVFPLSNTTYYLNKPPILSFPTVYHKVGSSSRQVVNYEEILALYQHTNIFFAWQAIFRVIRDTYGIKACVATIKSFPEYNDEGGQYLLAELTGVYDSDGRPLKPDFSLFRWKTEDLDKRFALYLSYLSLEDTASQIVNGLLALDGDLEGSYNLETPPEIPPPVYAELLDGMQLPYWKIRHEMVR